MALTLLMVGLFGCDVPEATAPGVSADVDEVDEAPEHGGDTGWTDTGDSGGCALVTSYRDADRDGWGVDQGAIEGCTVPQGRVTRGGDCDDENPEVSPGAVEQCGGTDEDCDGLTNEAGATGEATWYVDADGDGFGDPLADPVFACARSLGLSENAEDCDDEDAGVHPRAAELCDGVDQDCDGLPDDGVALPTWYRDLDGDGHGDPFETLDTCVQPDGYVDEGSDCDDGDDQINPNAEDTPLDGIDQDCDGSDDCSAPVFYAGNITFEDATAEADMWAFCASYDAVAGNVWVQDTTLAELAALDCLCEVEGSLYVEYNPSLTDLSALSSLSRIGGTLVVITNASLTTLEGMDSLASIGSLYVYDAPLTDLSGLEFVTELEEVYLGEMRTLTSLAGLENLERVNGDLTLYTLTALPDLSPLQKLTEVEEGLTLENLVALTSLGGLDHLTRVGRYLKVRNARLLTTLEGMTALGEVGGLWVLENDALVDLYGFEALVDLPDGLWVYYNTSLPDLRGLEGITSLGALRVSDGSIGASALASLDGLQGLTVVDGDVTIENYSNLTDLSGLDSLTEVGGSLGVSELYGLESVDGLDALDRVGSDLLLDGNPVLADLEGLGGVQEVGGDLTITDNAGLPTADALSLTETIPTIGGTVTVSGNAP